MIFLVGGMIFGKSSIIRPYLAVWDHGWTPTFWMSLPQTRAMPPNLNFGTVGAALEGLATGRPIGLREGGRQKQTREKMPKSACGLTPHGHLNGG